MLITHKLEEALAISDRVTILRGGRNVGELGPDEIAGANRDGQRRQRIVEMMFGRDVEAGRRGRREGGDYGRRGATRVLSGLCCHCAR